MRRTTQFNTAMEISSKLLIGMCVALFSSMTTAQEHNPFKNTAKPPAVQKQAPAPVPVFPVPTSPPPPQYMPSQPYAPPVSAVPYPPSGPTMARELPPPVIPVPQEYPVDSASSSEAPQKTQSTDEPSPKKKATGGFLNRDQIKSMRTNCHFEIKGDSARLSVPHYGGSVTIKLTGKHEPGCARAISVFDQWAEVEERDVFNLRVIVEPNEYQSPRTTSVFIASPGQSVEVTVRQAGNPRGEP